jgi:hypothetical protein
MVVIVSTFPALPQRTGRIEDYLFVQAAADDAKQAPSLADRPGSGLIVSGQRSLDAAIRLRKAQPELPLLLDRRRYAGKNRAPATAVFDPRWLDEQRRLGVPQVLSDSGYIGSGDIEGLRSVLDQASAADSDMTAVLPIHADWLRGDLPVLMAEVSSHAVPVALVLEHQGDPFGVLATVRGMVTLLRQAPSVALLCSDISALGALAFGASWAAVGVRTSLRHLYPANGSGFGVQAGVPSALVDPALALIKVDKIAAAWAATPDDPAWVCDCMTCHGRTLDWLLYATEYEANQHTFELLVDRRDSLVSMPRGSLRQQSWRAQCASAAFQYESLSLAGVAWDVPRFLKHWQAV